MPAVCTVRGCGSRSNRERLNFYRVPAALNTIYYPHLNELSRKRRERWLVAINREDLTDSKIKNCRVCSKHFFTGKPAALEDVHDIDWVPSLNMEPSKHVTKKQLADIKRTVRLHKRRKIEQVFIKTDIDPISNIPKDIESETMKRPGLHCINCHTLKHPSLDYCVKCVQFDGSRVTEINVEGLRAPSGSSEKEEDLDKLVKTYESTITELSRENEKLSSENTLLHRLLSEMEHTHSLLLFKMSVLEKDRKDEVFHGTYIQVK